MFQPVPPTPPTTVLPPKVSPATFFSMLIRYQPLSRQPLSGPPCDPPIAFSTKPKVMSGNLPSPQGTNFQPVFAAALAVFQLSIAALIHPSQGGPMSGS